MPELPEVETLRVDLEREIRGRTLRRSAVLQERMTRGQPGASIVQRLKGQRVEALNRRGKYLLIQLCSTDTLLIHRGMSGNMVLSETSELAGPHGHLVMELDDGRWLTLYDPRGFGEIRVLTSEELEGRCARMGPEPLGPGFTADYLLARWSGRTAPLKALLLDQAMVAGLGNIYSDECLWAAGLHPTRPAGSVTRAEAERLQHEVQRVLTEAIAHRGTTFSDAFDLYGKPGSHGDHLKVFHRAPGPCPRCAGPLAQTRVSNRGTSFCPTCQH
ncbi:MAG: bifunctional DNA-formamidopyrimidine glycosylase/DNA-(apurinic or apyrimidinic site) lyase [Chloroflexi bacterium]|nr:bifunctional DNA-formamidopyrimidine glycosylase/DNA-(apurinic or apyrimidinic site) lyase [Chloroflexota bacterium]